MNSKYFIITIDTEADNQWDITKEETTENVLFLPRFQELSEKYDFRPVWLSTYEIVNDKRFVKYFKPKQDNNLCEIGAHLHAWNNPPEYKLNHVMEQRPYLIEYPKKIMDEKLKTLTNSIYEKFGIKPVSHRSGRWAMNDEYFGLLSKYGYKVDCSVTPGVDWSGYKGESGMSGTDYTKHSLKPNFINGVLEVPVTIRNLRIFDKKRIHSLRNFMHECKTFIFKEKVWLRPLNNNYLYHMKKIINLKEEYLMFMIHSSELMPGGNPSFKDELSIEKLYEHIEELFKYARDKGYKGITLREYYDRVIKNDINK